MGQDFIPWRAKEYSLHTTISTPSSILTKSYGSSHYIKFMMLLPLAITSSILHKHLREMVCINITRSGNHFSLFFFTFPKKKKKFPSIIYNKLPLFFPQAKVQTLFIYLIFFLYEFMTNRRKAGSIFL